MRRRSYLGDLWIDHIVTIGIALSGVVLVVMTSALPWRVVGVFVVLWLLWELRRCGCRGKSSTATPER